MPVLVVLLCFYCPVKPIFKKLPQYSPAKAYHCAVYTFSKLCGLCIKWANIRAAPHLPLGIRFQCGMVTVPLNSSCTIFELLMARRELVHCGAGEIIGPKYSTQKL